MEGSECAITPRECMNDSDAEDFIVDGIDCPIFKQSENEKEDKILVKNMKNKQKYQQELFKLQQHNEAKQQSQLQMTESKKNNIKIYGHASFDMDMDRDNAEFVGMVMENEIVPRQYHRIWLYVSVIASVVFMCFIPIRFYLHYKLCD